MADNGRGIPVGNHRDYKNKSAAEVVLTVLHAGGKFGGEGYKISGGLHGVGVSVVNALSSRLDLEIHTDGSRWEMSFANGGKPTGKLVQKAASKKTGTTVTFWPDATIFEETEFRAQTLIERLREMAFLNKGLEIRFRDERVSPVAEQTFKFAGGITDFVRHLNASKEPIFKRVVAFEDSTEENEVDVAMQWNTGYHEGIHSFANNIATTEGGMHEEGFKKALTNAVNKYCRGKNILKEKDDNLLGEDIREGLTAIISVKLRNPQFEGQTKTKLGNTEMRSMVEKATNEKLGEWLEEHPAESKQIVAKATQAQRAPRRGSPGARSHAPQVPARVVVDAGQARRLLVEEPRGLRAVHRRGRQRRRIGQARAQPGVPGDPADPGEDPQRRARPHGQDAEERGDPDAHHRGGHRHRRGVRRREAPLPQDHPHERRRRRRLAHPHAAAHVPLPADARAGAWRARVRGAAAAVPRRHRQGADLPQGRGRAA